jgi:probable DNA metabolism protein
MSELPIEVEIVRFGFKTLAAAKGAANAVRQAVGKAVPADWTAYEEARLGAERQAHDRGDAGVRAVLAAAYKVAHEIDRMRGFLRFSPNGDGVYMARCAPDHFVLPALAAHFTRRFGEQGWAIIDEKRKLCLSRRPGEPPQLFDLPSSLLPANNDPWIDLWRHYHRTINNESRKNPQLQRQFMPERYWKYLPEFVTNE